MLPVSKVVLHEVGPREGIQLDGENLSTADKVAFVNALSLTGLRSIEVTSFVSPKWVPTMADAEQVMAAIARKPGVAYTAIYLNPRGLERALAAKASVEGVLVLTASEAFCKRNTNRTIAETLSALPEWIATYQRAAVPVDQVAVMATFGCNFEGHVPLAKVLEVVGKAIAIAAEHGEQIKTIKLADTMGWANPEQIKRTIETVRSDWPKAGIALHLHDTRGLGLANAYAAMEMGVCEFDSAVAGLGGCPFAAVKGAAGNISTEDLAFLCDEAGVETGIDPELLLECARMAERIFRKPLPSHLPKGGLFRQVRRETWAHATHGAQRA
jgi:hydroxymethylglutaryl-CoA lyase